MRIVVPDSLVNKVFHDKDHWHLRALALATMLEMMGVDVEEILTGQKETCIKHILQANLMESSGASWDLHELVDIFNSPVAGDK